MYWGQHTWVRAMQPSRETCRRKGKLSAMLVMAMQPSMDRFSSRVNVSNATTCASATAL